MDEMLEISLKHCQQMELAKVQMDYVKAFWRPLPIESSVVEKEQKFQRGVTAVNRISSAFSLNVINFRSSSLFVPRDHD